MRIAHLEIANFRKLLSVRLDLSPSTTLFVGANNSGKTSAVVALRYFLLDASHFSLNDFTLSRWPKIKAIGETWAASETSEPTITEEDWIEVVPALDVWFDVAVSEFHHVAKLIPSLNWNGGLLGVRLRFEPKDLDALRDDYLSNIKRVAELKTMAAAPTSGFAGTMAKLWPENLVEFLERRLQRHFTVRAYLLDPTKLTGSIDGQAAPQSLGAGQSPAELDDVRSLMRVDEIDAQRGFGQSNPEGDEGGPRGRSLLSAQLRSYFSRHLDPTDAPDVKDLAALKAIEDAQRAFDERLDQSFKSAIGEVQGLGYPGVTDPKITLSTRLRPMDGLNHQAAVQYRVDTNDNNGALLHLPEDFNGLGYQNLISMIFRLMSFRDGWMRVGKAAGQNPTKARPPLHLVLVEEPEAHLHAQVQQVFAKKAYTILREHPSLKHHQAFTTQLVISTHSIHVAHELDFSNLRYFRRLPAGKAAIVPVSSVINLEKVFGAEDETQRFVTRYLKAQHCDLFFADAAILVEGPAERMLIPHFIRRKFDFLNQCYVTLLEVGGSHAHRLKPLIDHLGLVTVIVTDIDSQGPDEAPPTKGGAKQTTSKDTLKKWIPEPTKRGAKQTTNNDTLKKWVPKISNVDELLDASPEEKICDDDGHLFAVRVAYQTPIMVTSGPNGSAEEALPYTFEDALVLENRPFFENLSGGGLVGKFRKAFAENASIEDLEADFFRALRGGNKAEFVLDVISSPEFENIVAPAYIVEALQWLELRLRKKQTEILTKGLLSLPDTNPEQTSK
jgi:predicted ATP-dependent endonuclease of OLD family